MCFFIYSSSRFDGFSRHDTISKQDLAILWDWSKWIYPLYGHKNGPLKLQLCRSPFAVCSKYCIISIKYIGGHWPWTLCRRLSDLIRYLIKFCWTKGLLFWYRSRHDSESKTILDESNMKAVRYRYQNFFFKICSCSFSYSYPCPDPCPWSCPCQGCMKMDRDMNIPVLTKSFFQRLWYRIS